MLAAPPAAVQPVAHCTPSDLHHTGYKPDNLAAEAAPVEEAYFLALEALRLALEASAVERRGTPP